MEKLTEMLEAHERKNLKILCRMFMANRYDNEMKDALIPVMDAFSVWIDNHFGEGTTEKWIEQICIEAEESYKKYCEMRKEIKV